jgi:hypothetical protein
MRSALRSSLVVSLAIGLVAALSAVAIAASPHFKKGGEPVCTVSGSGTNSTSTTCKATLAGLGNGDLTIRTTVSGSAVYECQNHGGQTAPGQNRVLQGPVTAPTTIPSGSIKNGSVTFTTNPAVLSAPSTVSGSQAGCPNSNWTGVRPRLTLTDITMTIAQSGSTLFTCSASNPNGLTGRVALAC